MTAAKFNKKKSKRVSCRRRFKVEKKVREHKRKVRKEQKKLKKGTKKSGLSKKPDVQIPNKCPFKEDVLREAQERKEKAEELKAAERAQRAKELREKQKGDRKKLIDKHRNLDDIVDDAEAENTKFENTMALTAAIASFVNKGANEADKSASISLKAYYSEVKKVIELSDVVLEILDARDPLGSRCSVVEESVLSSGKRLVLILNKIDLVPKRIVEKWLTYLRGQLPTVAFKASTQKQQKRLGRAGHAFVDTSKCVGADILMHLLGNYCRNKDIKTSIRVGVVGFPNVGKSSIINSLKRKVVCNAGATPGVTRNVQEVHLDKKIRLLDSPGVVVATQAFDPVEMALKNAVRIESLSDPITPVEALLRRCQKQSLMLQYNLPDFGDVNEFLGLLARKRGVLRKGGVPHIKMAARIVLNDWNVGKLRYYTEPPEDDNSAASAFISSELVTEMSKEFDLDAIDEEQRVLVEDLPSYPLMETDSIVFAGQLTFEKPISKNGDETEEMETDTASSSRVRTEPPSRKSRAVSPDRSLEKDKEMRLEGNQQSNKVMHRLMKKSKKKGKRADKLAGKLSDAMDAAMSAFGVSSKKVTEGDAYDFDEHFD